MEVVYVVMHYNKDLNTYELCSIFKSDIKARKWINLCCEDENNYKVECWKVN